MIYDNNSKRGKDDIIIWGLELNFCRFLCCIQIFYVPFLIFEKVEGRGGSLACGQSVRSLALLNATLCNPLMY